MRKPILTADNLSYLSEQNSAKTTSNIAAYLCDAINDYPKQISQPAEFVDELKNEIGNDLTFWNIKKYCENLNPKKDAWKMESLSSVMLMFEGNEINTLDELITNLTEVYKNNI